MALNRPARGAVKVAVLVFILGSPRVRLAAQIALALALVAGCGRSSKPPGERAGPISRFGPTKTSAVAGSGETAYGMVVVPAAQSFTDRGFHDTLTVAPRFPARGPALREAVTVSLALRDASRPRQMCSEDHPLSGCVTVDWSDDPARPHVPMSGVFVNALTVVTADGARTLYLHPAGTLTARPERFVPG